MNKEQEVAADLVLAHCDCAGYDEVHYVSLGYARTNLQLRREVARLEREIQRLKEMRDGRKCSGSA